MATSGNQERTRERRVARIVNEAEQRAPGLADEWAASSGLRFKLRKFPRATVVAAIKKVPIPKVPVLYNPDKDRDEENPNDPTYKTEMQMADYEAYKVSGDVFIALGTTLVESTVPAGLEKHTDKGWADTLNEVAGLEIPANGLARYVAWLRYHALADEELALLVRAAMSYNGFVMPEEVAAAEADFPGDATRDTDS